jgi:hypothetical protein
MERRVRYRELRWTGTPDEIDYGRARVLLSIIRKAARDPVLHAFTLRLLKSAGVQPRDNMRQIRAIQRFVQCQVGWVPEAGDMYYHPLITLQNGFGDCDDLCTLAGAMMETIKIPVRVRILRRNGIGVHTFPAAGYPIKAPSEWIPVEVSLRVPLGWDPKGKGPAVVRAMT